jgi:hypothetical protein
MTNLMKYALGLDPKAPTSGPGVVVSQSGAACALTYQRPANRPDLVYSVEVSTDLSTWAVSGVTMSAITSGDPQTWQGSYPSDQSTKLFLRLRVTQM